MSKHRWDQVDGKETTYKWLDLGLMFTLEVENGQWCLFDHSDGEMRFVTQGQADENFLEDAWECVGAVLESNIAKAMIKKSLWEKG